MNTQLPKSALAINKKASVNDDVTSRFDVVRKNLLKSQQLVISVVFAKG